MTIDNIITGLFNPSFDEAGPILVRQFVQVWGPSRLPEASETSGKGTAVECRSGIPQCEIKFYKFLLS